MGDAKRMGQGKTKEDSKVKREVEVIVATVVMITMIVTVLTVMGPRHQHHQATLIAPCLVSPFMLLLSHFSPYGTLSSPRVT